MFVLHRFRNEEVSGSIPLSSTKFSIPYGIRAKSGDTFVLLFALSQNDFPAQAVAYGSFIDRESSARCFVCRRMREAWASIIGARWKDGCVVTFS